MPNKEKEREDMQHVTVVIAGRSYRMACGPGEEMHLQDLATLFDQRIEELRLNVGEIGDMRLHVMAALTLADELKEAERKIYSLENGLQDIHHIRQEEKEREVTLEQSLTETMLKVAERIEKLAVYLNSPPDNQ